MPIFLHGCEIKSGRGKAEYEAKLYCSHEKKIQNNACGDLWGLGEGQSVVASSDGRADGKDVAVCVFLSRAWLFHNEWPGCESYECYKNSNKKNLIIFVAFLSREQLNLEEKKRKKKETWRKKKKKFEKQKKPREPPIPPGVSDTRSAG